MRSFVYPVGLARDPEDGYIVSCRDLPEVITQGDTREDALEAAKDAE
jgi:antitoxin HicB